MEDYIEDMRFSSPSHRRAHQGAGVGLSTWTAFALGGVVTFLFVYIGVARPAARELSLLRRQISTLEQSVWEVAGHKGDVENATNLLDMLAAQREQISDARKVLAEMKQLNEALSAEGTKVQVAMSALDELGYLKDSLLSAADQASDAAAVLTLTEDVSHRLAVAASTTDLALQASDDLLALRDDLIQRSGEVEEAKQTLDELIDIREKIDTQSQDVEKAKDRVAGLIDLKDSVVSNTDDLVDAIETLEVSKELSHRFHDAALSFDRIRHWMVEMVSMEPMFEQARASLEPLLELGNLRRLAPGQLRQVASMISQENGRIATKPSDLDLQPETTLGQAIEAPTSTK